MENHVLHTSSDYRATPPNTASTLRLQRQISTHWKWWWRFQAALWQRLEIKVYFNSTPEVAWTFLESKLWMVLNGSVELVSQWVSTDKTSGHLNSHWSRQAKLSTCQHYFCISRYSRRDSIILKHKTLKRQLIWVKFWYCLRDKRVVPPKGNAIIKTDLPQLASGKSESNLGIHLHRQESEQLCWGSETDDTEEWTA